MFPFNWIAKVFLSLFGEFYKAENPVRFWSLWNPSRVEMSVGIYKTIRKFAGKWIHYPFSVIIFFFWGFCDDITLLFFKWITGIELFPFGFWSVAIGSQSFVVLAWKKISRYLPDVPLFISRPLTMAYAFGMITFIRWIYY